MSLRHALLGLLVFRPGSGYDLLKIFNTSLGHVWPARQSQIYGELTRLDATGLITVTDEGPRGRKQYALTPEGHAEARRWLAGTEEHRPRRDPMLLQTFFLGLLPAEEAAARLLRHADTAAEEHAELVALRDSGAWDRDAMTECGRLVLEYGLRHRALEQEWARWAAERLREGRPRAPAAQELAAYEPATQEFASEPAVRGCPAPRARPTPPARRARHAGRRGR